MLARVTTTATHCAALPDYYVFTTSSEGLQAAAARV